MIRNVKLYFRTAYNTFKRLTIQMKKNISKLIAQINRGASATRKEGFKLTCKNASNYVNKILVDEE